MSNVMKTVLAGATVLALAGGSLVYAQQRPDAAPGNAPRMSAEDVVAYGDARIAALKAGLKLTAEQEKHWPALEKALKDSAKQRSERFAARASADAPKDPIARLKLQADAMSARGASLKTIADAAAPLYGSLDDAQKQRFVRLAYLEGGRGHHMRGHHGMHHGGGMHHHGMREGAPAGGDQPPAPRQ